MFLPTNITLKFGDSGDFVSELQRRLSVINCFNESGINGFFDGLTVNGVSQFQSMSGIQADGIAGPETLRRLNGAISGDYSSSDHQADTEAKLSEEQAQLLLQQQREQALREEQALIAQQQQERAYQLQMQPQAAAAAGKPEANLQQAATATPAQHHTPVHTVAPELPQHQAYATSQAQLPQSQHTPAPAAPSASDILAQMLLATQAQPTPQPQAQPIASVQAQPQQPQSTQAPHVAVAAAVAPQPAPQQAYVPPTQTAAVAPTPVAPPAAAAVAPMATQQPAQAPQAQTQTQQDAAPEQPRGVVGRAVQYANQVVQKLASYFEEKLPSHVISEVKEIGQTMAKAGMKEAAIPTGPEPQRGVDTPGKSQQQGKQLG